MSCLHRQRTPKDTEACLTPSTCAIPCNGYDEAASVLEVYWHSPSITIRQLQYITVISGSSTFRVGMEFFIAMLPRINLWCSKSALKHLLSVLEGLFHYKAQKPAVASMYIFIFGSSLE